MKTKIQRWGNSLGLRVPKSFVEEANIEAGSTVDISIEDGDLIVRPVRRRYELGSLVRGINAKNMHDAIDTGERVGREAW